MLTPADLIALSAMTQKECTTAVRIAAYLLRTGKSVTERSLKGALDVTDLKWEEVKKPLSSIFSFKSGRVDWMSEGERPAPWEIITQADEKAIGKDLQRAIDRNNIVLTDAEARVHALGGLTPPQARALFHQMRSTYGAETVTKALDRIGTKKPDNPRPYLTSIIKKIVEEGASASPSGARPATVKAYIKPSSAGNGSTEYVGWEAPVSIDLMGNPIYPAGERRQLFRLPTGHVKPFKAEGPIPSHTEEPGSRII